MERLHMRLTDMSGNALDPVEFFGKEAYRLDSAMKMMLIASRDRYHGCYNIQNHVSLEEWREYCIENPDTPITFAQMVAKVHPEEFAKQNASRMERDVEIARAVRTVYGYAKRQYMRLEWHGTSSPIDAGRWTVYKHGEKVASIQL